MAVEKGAVSSIVNGMRFVDGGEITSLAQDFTAGTGSPVSIKLIPKDFSNFNDVEFVNLVFYQQDNDTPKEWPIHPLSWTGELLRTFSASNAALLTNYRIFWTTGSDVTIS